MRRKRQGRGLIACVLVLAVLGGVAYLLLRTPPVTAGAVRRDPRAFSGRTVTVSGTVVGSASVVGTLLKAVGGGGGIFLLDDGTGQIAVVTSGLAPQKGQRVRVTGEVQVLATLSLPDAWLKGFTGGNLTAVVLRAKQVTVR